MTRHGARSWLAYAAVAALALTTLGLLYRKTTQLDAEAESRYDTLLDAISKGVALVDEDVLRVRQGLLHHYDTLESGLTRLDARAAQLDAVPAYCSDDRRSALLAAAQRVRLALASKREAIEDFKADRAILVNSLRYLPVEVAEVSAGIPAGHADRLVAERLEGLLRDLLVYNLHGDAGSGAAARAGLDALEALEAASRGGLGNAALAIEHAERILAYKPLVDADSERILASPVATVLAGLAAIFDAGNAEAVRSANAYRVLLIGVCLALAAAIMVFVHRLRHALGQLAAVNAHLELRVGERTAELAATNRELAARIDERELAISRQAASQVLLEQAMAGVRMHEAHNRAVFAAMEEGVVVQDDRATIISSNAAAARILGLSDDQVRGRTPLDPAWRAVREDGTPFPGEEHPAVLALRTGRAVRGVVMGVGTVEADRRWILINAQPLMPEGQGAPHEVVCSFSDITALRRNECERRRAESQFERFFTLSPDLLCIADMQGRFLRINPAWTRALGWSAEELVARPFLEFVHPDDAERTIAETSNLAAGGMTVDFENRYCRRDGGWVSLSWKAAVSDEGVVLAVARDVTSKRAHERELTEAKEKAEAATRAKAQFLATMSHEIRTPMNGVIGMTQVLLKTPLGAEQRDMMETIQRSGQALLDIINDILDYSKITEGAVDIRRSSFAPRDLVADVLATMAPQAAAKGLVLLPELDPALPARLVGDVGRLRQILCNLVGNAVKFTNQGGATVTVEALAEGEGGLRGYRFSVSDTGIGIATADRPRLFKRFAQLDATPSRRYGGTGLGLAICKRLVEMMGGSITVGGVEGEGSTFAFTIPLATAADAPTERGIPVVTVLRPLRLLVVDDNRTNQLVLKAMLSQHEQAPEFASDGSEALAAHARAPWDVILMDVQMPVMDGLEATRQIRLREAAAGAAPVAIIALTAGVMQEEREACLASGMMDVVAKPVTEELLIATIARWAPPAPQGGGADAAATATGIADEPVAR